MGEQGAHEIAEIAKAGGGISRIAGTRDLSRTVQMVTRKTVAMTITQTVQKELHKIYGEAKGELESLPLEERAQVVQIIEDLGEQTGLRVAVLIDTSASMNPKLAAVKEAVRDLQLSLQARQGSSELCVFSFPAHADGQASAAMEINWTQHLEKMGDILYNLNMKGTTPTGPAIMQLVRFISRTEKAAEPVTEHKDGIWSEYVV